MKYILLFTTLFLGACQTQEQKSLTFDLMITHASIIDVAEGNVRNNHFIGIKQDTIVLVDKMEHIDKYKALNTIDAQNKYIMPGLWDNHVHFRGHDSIVQENKKLLPLNIVFGVTSIRDAGGDMTNHINRWKEEIKADKLVGPNIYTSGPKFDGSKPAWAGSIKLQNATDVKNGLDSLASLGADYVKNYDGSLNVDMYYELIKQAEERGYQMTGHMPLSADLMKAVALGLDGIEHMYYLYTLTSPVADSIRKLNKNYAAMGDLLYSFDNDLALEVFKKLGKQGFFVSPTIHIGEVLNDMKTEDHSNDSLLKFIGPGIQKSYEYRFYAKSYSPEVAKQRNDLELKNKELLLPMVDAGINLLAGTDSGPYNAFVYPGTGLHNELISYVAAGLSPQQALSTSIINGPKFFSLEEYYGGIENGKVAHLIILENNPLENIEHIRSLKTVVKGTKVYDQNYLNKLLQSLSY